MLFKLSFLIISFYVVQTIGQNIVSPRANDSVTQMVQEAGYPIEVYDIKTKDNYIIRMHRIPSGPLWKIMTPPTGLNAFERMGDEINNFVGTRNKPVVLLNHGLFCSSADWVVMGPGKSLAYILVDSGYDVWMGNFRGNLFSRKHSYLDPDTAAEYWDFSWHEMGYYDLPTMINYILMKTNSSSLHYVAHSQGFTAMMVTLSTRPKFNRKIISINAMSPVVYLAQTTNPVVKTAVTFYNEIVGATKLFGINELSSTSSSTKTISNILCADLAATQELCANMLLFTVGFDSKQLNRTMLPKILENMPAGSSFRQLAHFGQLIRSNKFQMFDFGDNAKNFQRYNQFQPPEYNLDRVIVPMQFFYGSGDTILSSSDVDSLGRRMKKALEKKYLIYDWNHLDFLYAMDGYKMVYNRISENIRKKHNMDRNEPLQQTDDSSSSSSESSSRGHHHHHHHHHGRHDRKKIF